jgi:hypothetical protein
MKNNIRLGNEKKTNEGRKKIYKNIDIIFIIFCGRRRAVAAVANENEN